MNGPHDLGGSHGFGAVTPESHEPPFHSEWERRVFAITLAMGATGQWNLDQSRYARESLPPSQYLSSSYYEIWFAGLRRLLVERGLVDDAEITTGRVSTTPRQLSRRLAGADVAGALARGGPVRREDGPVGPRFQAGDRVQARRINPTGHTRLPRYVRGRDGTVVRCHGRHVFPDAHAAGLGEQPEWLYTVEFDARELWGPDTSAESVCVDCWEPYLV